MTSTERDICELRNLGEKSAQWLREVGVETVEQLRSLGAVEVYLRLRRERPDVSLNLLWAMSAGLDDRDWRDLTKEEKARLLAELENLE